MRDYLNMLQPEELKDVVVLGATNTAPNSIISTKKIESVEDLQGMQIRASGAAVNAISSWGATPVSMTIGEIYEGLRSGLIDGAYLIPAVVGNSTLQEVAKHQLIIPIGGACQLIIMNKGLFESMPAAQQALLMDLCNEVFDEYISTYIENYELPCHESSVKGIKGVETINYLEGELLNTFLEMTQSIADKYTAELDALGMDGTSALELAR